MFFIIPNNKAIIFKKLLKYLISYFSVYIEYEVSKLIYTLENKLKNNE
jgi:hypothetical protein